MVGTENPDDTTTLNDAMKNEGALIYIKQTKALAISYSFFYYNIGCNASALNVYAEGVSIDADDSGSEHIAIRDCTFEYNGSTAGAAVI